MIVINKFEQDEMPNVVISGLPTFDRFIFTVSRACTTLIVIPWQKYIAYFIIGNS